MASVACHGRGGWLEYPDFDERCAEGYRAALKCANAAAVRDSAWFVHSGSDAA